MISYSFSASSDDNWPCVFCFEKAVQLFPQFVNQQNRLGNSPLHTLSQSVRYPLSRAEILAAHGATFELCNNEGKTPKQVAKNTATTVPDLEQAIMNAKKAKANSGCTIS